MLTELHVKNAKPRETRFKLYDSRGLYLIVNPSGSKRWEFRYKFPGPNGKLVSKTLSFGMSDEVGLKVAREKAVEARNQLRESIDPAAEKSKRQVAAQYGATNTLSHVAAEWFRIKSPAWTPLYGKKLWRRIEMHIFPTLGNRPICDIGALDLLRPLQEVEAAGKTQMAHTLLQICQAIFRYAVITQRVRFNIARELEGALRPHAVTHYPSIDPRELSDFIQKFNATPMPKRDRIAMSLLMLTMLRTGELRKSKRSAVKFSEGLWEIDKDTVKKRLPHVVPLSRQAKALLHQAYEHSEGSEYLFPPERPHKLPYMCENTINNTIHAMGYKSSMVGHGFRSLASTTMNMHGLHEEAIEFQLAHIPGNRVRAIYNRYKYLEERRQIMQWWGNYLEKAGLKIE